MWVVREDREDGSRDERDFATRVQVAEDDHDVVGLSTATVDDRGLDAVRPVLDSDAAHGVGAGCRDRPTRRNWNFAVEFGHFGFLPSVGGRGSHPRPGSLVFGLAGDPALPVAPPLSARPALRRVDGGRPRSRPHPPPLAVDLDGLSGVGEAPEGDQRERSGGRLRFDGADRDRRDERPAGAGDLVPPHGGRGHGGRGRESGHGGRGAEERTDDADDTLEHDHLQWEAFDPATAAGVFPLFASPPVRVRHFAKIPKDCAGALREAIALSTFVMGRKSRSGSVTGQYFR